MRVRLVSAALVALVVSGCGTPPMSKCGPSTGTVVSVVDGDTIELESGVKIRYLLTDTTEITKGHNDCYGQEAAALNRMLVEGKKIDLKYDEAGCTDRYGRTLAYVSVGGVEVNSKLVKEGYACTLYVSPSGGTRRDEFETYESEAKTARLGLWGACTTVTCE